MPDIYIPQLQDAWRKDLVDLYKSGEEAKLKNLMDGYSVLKEMTEDYLLLQTTERTVIEMKLLPIEKDTNIICMITTFSAPVSDSKIDFFTIDWNPLPTEDFFTPPAKELFLKKVKGSDAEIKKNTACLDIDFIQYNFDKKKARLTATYMTPFYLGKEEQKNIKPYLLDKPRIYNWKNGRFVLNLNSATL